MNGTSESASVVITLGPERPADAKSPPITFPGMTRGTFLRGGDWVTAARGQLLFGADKETQSTLKLPSSVQWPCCVEGGARGVCEKVNCGHRAWVSRDISQEMCGEQAIVTQWVTVRYKDSELFSRTGIGGSSQLLMWKCFRCRKSEMWMAFCPLSFSPFVSFSLSACQMLKGIDHSLNPFRGHTCLTPGGTILPFLQFTVHFYAFSPLSVNTTCFWYLTACSLLHSEWETHGEMENSCFLLAILKERETDKHRVSSSNIKFYFS